MTRWPPRPTLAAAFYKGHGLGNDYLVFEEGDAWVATPGNVRRVCDRHLGVGSDGIVAVKGKAVRGSDPARVTAQLRIFNPDGGEFERSGNGLRVFASYVASRSPDVTRIDVQVGGDEVGMIVHGRRGPVHDVSVEMGRALTEPSAVGLEVGAVLKGPGQESLEIVPVSIGNPHLVTVVASDESADFSEARLADLGPHLATHPALAHGANVQLATPTGPPGTCRALIWERGVGRTSASGTSACAVAVAMVSTGRLSAGRVVVTMPGGALTVDVSPELDVILRGPVEEVLDGRLRSSALSTFERAPGA